MRIWKFQKIIINIVNLMGRKVLVDSKVGNSFASNRFCLIGLIVYVLHPLLWLVMKLLSQIFYKWISIVFLLKKLFLKFYANGFPYIYFIQELLFSNIVVTYVQFDSKIRVLYVFLFFLKNTAQNTQSGKGYAKNHYRAATREPFC